MWRGQAVMHAHEIVQVGGEFFEARFVLQRGHKGLDEVVVLVVWPRDADGSPNAPGMDA